MCALVAQAAVQAQRGFIHSHAHTQHTHGNTYIHIHSLIRVQTHTVSLCPLHTRHPLSHPRQQDSRRTHTHTKEQTDAVTLEMQAKHCRGEKFSLKLENSLFISAFGLQEEFCLFVRFSCLCSSFSSLLLCLFLCCLGAFGFS